MATRGGSGLDTSGGSEDPWARFAEQVGWDEVPETPSDAAPVPGFAHADFLAPAPSPALPPAPSSEPARPLGMPVLVAAPAPAPTLLRKPTAAAPPLPTQPSLEPRPQSGSQAAWRARALELGLRSAFVAAPDDLPPAQEPHETPGGRLLAGAHTTGALRGAVQRPT